MHVLIASLCLLATVFIYFLSKKLSKKIPIMIFSPLIISPLAIILIIYLFKIDYSTYNDGAKYLTNLLGPATVAFAVPIYKNFHLIKKYAATIVFSLVFGVIIAFGSSYFLALIFGMSSETIYSIVPRSVTTPIAMDISSMIGGEPNMTAVFVIITGLAGSVVGPYIIKYCRIQSPSARGLMLGMGAHGCGTSTAFTFGELEGTFSSLAMILAALVSIVVSELMML